MFVVIAPVTRRSSFFEVSVIVRVCVSRSDACRSYESNGRREVSDVLGACCVAPLVSPADPLASLKSLSPRPCPTAAARVHGLRMAEEGVPANAELV